MCPGKLETAPGGGFGGVFVRVCSVACVFGDLSGGEGGERCEGHVGRLEHEERDITQ